MSARSRYLRLYAFVRATVRAVRDAGSGFAEHHGLVLAAAMAFHIALALAPLLLLTVWIATLINPDFRQPVIDRMEILLGEQGAATITELLRDATAKPRLKTLVGWVLLGSLLVTTSGAFIQLQWSLNTIWGVRSRPWRKIWPYVKKRLLSLAMIGLFGLLLLGSIIADTTLSFLASEVGGVFRLDATEWNIIEPIISLAIVYVLFASFFRVLPDVRLTRGQVAVGAAITGGLFALGKVLIARYLGTRTMDSIYGAAGSFIAILLWVYYSSIIFFFGVELTRAWVERSGARPEVEGFAEREEHDPPHRGREPSIPSDAGLSDGREEDI